VIEQAVLLVGGRGTRLGELTRDTPKPLLEVAGRPFILWLVDELRRFGVGDILLLAGYRAEQFAALFAREADVRVVAEEHPLGTGGALRFAIEHLADRFFFLNGDSFFDINLWDLAAFEPAAEATLAVRTVADAARYGRVQLEGRQITGFASRSSASGAGLINGGVGVFARRIVDRIEAGRPVSIEADVYPSLAAEGRLAGRAYDGAFIDIGVPEEFQRAQSFIPHQLRRGAVVFYTAQTLLDGGRETSRRPGEHARTTIVDAIKAVNDAGLLALMAAPSGPSVASYRAQANAILAPFGAHLDGVLQERAPSRSEADITAEIERMAAAGQFSIDPSRIGWIESPERTPERSPSPGVPPAHRGGPEQLDQIIARLTRSTV
jgi:D-glycero-D-manno-heptose 1,7-bisphosphate phosphatase